MTHIFCLSLSSCQVPSRWKTAHVVPIPKKSCSNITDFRPISLLPLPSKILERIVLTSVKSALIDSYGSNQFGFRPGSSTLLAHISLHDFVTRHMDRTTTHGVILVTFDMKKAFDSLSHASLLKSLSAVKNLPSNFIIWLENFLQSRQQKVIINGTLSTNTVQVTSGVPQGSVLAPYLFASHMGSLTPASSEARMIKYADDVSLLFPYTQFDSVQTILHIELQNMRNWCSNHGLSLNDNKTRVLIFKKPRIDYATLNTLNPVPNTDLNILGVIFNHYLSWDSHVDLVTKSASRRIHVLRQLKRIPSATRLDLLKVYESFILSVLEYNSPIFVGMSRKNSKKLESIRKRCHRVICGTLCDCEDFPSLRARRLQKSMKTFITMQNPQHLSHDLLPCTLQYTKHFCLELTKTERRLNSFVPFCCRLYNCNR